MFMSVVDTVPGVAVYPELAGQRVLVTGLTPSAGLDVARAFAGHRTYLIAQSADPSPAMTEIAAVLAQSATQLQIFDDELATEDAARAFARKATQVHGGIDAAVNLITISRTETAALQTESEIEAFISSKLSAVMELTRVLANRMRTTWIEGSILNVVLMEESTTKREIALGGIIHAALAAATRIEAKDWAEHAIRINAIGPRGVTASGAALAGETEVASLALYLASKKGRTLSGQMFDAHLLCGRA